MSFAFYRKSFLKLRDLLCDLQLLIMERMHFAPCILGHHGPVRTPIIHEYIYAFRPGSTESLTSHEGNLYDSLGQIE